MIFSFLSLLFFCSVSSVTLKAGVSKIDGTLPIGVPLAGYNHGDRRVPFWPIPVPREYTTWMEGNVGALNPSWVKALMIEDHDGTVVCFITMDAIGADGVICDAAYNAAIKNLNFLQNFPRENLICSASHTHSGPGAMSTQFLWEVAPAVDLIVPIVKDMYVGFMVEAMTEAYNNMQPALLDIGVGNLTGVTRNRRAERNGKKNPYLNSGTIDPHLGVIGVNSASGKPIATLWNYATHGTCYGPSNMKFSSDIAGAVCDLVEDTIGGVALFVNADAGDIDPTSETCGCNNGHCQFSGAPKFVAQIKKNKR